MRVDLNVSITGTFSLRSSWLWQMQTVVSYQYSLEPTLRRVTLMCLKTRHLENYWRTINWILQTQVTQKDYPCLLCFRWRGVRLIRACVTAISQQKVTFLKRICNYRLLRARRIFECAFGILGNERRIFHRPTDVKPDFCDNIVKACCVLYNYVRKNYGIQFDDTLYECPLESVEPVGTNGSVRGIAVRAYFAKYFISPQGVVPWQYGKM